MAVARGAVYEDLVAATAAARGEPPLILVGFVGRVAEFFATPPRDQMVRRVPATLQEPLRPGQCVSILDLLSLGDFPELPLHEFARGENCLLPMPVFVDTVFARPDSAALLAKALQMAIRSSRKAQDQLACVRVCGVAFPEP
jgi:hypothetical protein